MVSCIRVERELTETMHTGEGPRRGFVTWGGRQGRDNRIAPSGRNRVAELVCQREQIEMQRVRVHRVVSILVMNRWQTTFHPQ